MWGSFTAVFASTRTYIYWKTEEAFYRNSRPKWERRLPIVRMYGTAALSPVQYSTVG